MEPGFGRDKTFTNVENGCAHNRLLLTIKNILSRTGTVKSWIQIVWIFLRDISSMPPVFAWSSTFTYVPSTKVFYWRKCSKCESVSIKDFNWLAYATTIPIGEIVNHPFSIQVQILVVVDSYFYALNDKLLICATQKDRTTWNICTAKYSSSANIGSST